MARIVVVDDEESIRALLVDALTPMGHDVQAFPEVEGALFWLDEASADLIIADINMPGTNGFEFRDILRSKESLASIPFVFLTAGDASVERALAERMTEEIVLFKPVNLPSLRRLVESLAGELEREEGAIAAEALGRVFRRIADEQTTAVMSAFRGSKSKKLIFEDGVLKFAISNDPHELIGQALIRAGMVSEHGLIELFQAKRGRDLRLGEVFLEGTTDAPQALQELLAHKVREAALDVFLWKGGWFEVFYGGVDVSEVPFTADHALIPIVDEGTKRAETWAKIVKILPGPRASFSVKWPIPPDELKSAGDRLMSELIGEGCTREQIELELRGQRFGVGIALARWLKAGYIEVVEEVARPRPTPPPMAYEPLKVELPERPGPEISRPTPADSGPIDKGAMATQLLAQAITMFRDGLLVEARELFLQALELDPANGLARIRLTVLDQMLQDKAGDTGLAPDRMIAASGELPDDMDLDSEEAFVYARIAEEPITVEALVCVCPIPEPDVLRILMRFVANGLVKVG